MADAIYTMDVLLSRYAFSTRDVAQPLELWRACQNVATSVTSVAGWPPDRFVREHTAFVVYRMSMSHGRDVHYGEPLVARTWLSAFRRRTLCTREIRLEAKDGLVVSATQQWAHVDDLTRKPAQASQDLVDALPVHKGDGSVALDKLPAASGQATTFAFTPWHTAMDPLGHVNHPDYIQWCDESVAQRLADIDIDPVNLVSVAESITYKRPVVARDKVTVLTKPIGADDDTVEFVHEISSDGDVAALARTQRRLVDSEARVLLGPWSEQR